MAFLKRVVASVCAFWLLSAAQAVSAQQLTADDRLCSDQSVKAARNVVNQAQKANRACVKHGEGDITTCVDMESEKAMERRGELAALFQTGELCATVPPFGVNPNPDAIADAVEAGSARIIRAIFGNPANGVLADDKCSDKMAQRTGKKYDTVFKNFRKCAKHLATINSIADLEGCVIQAGTDATIPQGKLDADVDAECSTLPPIPPPGTEDGTCGSQTTAAGFSACLGRRVNCEACVAINTMIGGSADCDLADDGLANSSCLASHTCTLTSASKVTLYTGSTQVLLPSGAIDVSCGVPGSGGTAACTCSVKSFSPINVGGNYYACLKPPTASCPALQRDCDGGSALNFNVAGRRNIGSCSSNATCATQCATQCGGAANVLESGCEGFCSDGAQMACTTDVGCAGQGACNGPNNPGSHVCDCSCVTAVASPAARVGAISCLLAFDLSIEALPGDGMPCDGGSPGDNDVLIEAGDMCAPLTTEFASGQITNANNGGTSIPTTPFNKSGAPLACNVLDAGTTSGLRFAGTDAFFALPTGDVFMGLEAVCQ